MKTPSPPRGETGPNYTLLRRRTKTLTSTSHRYQAAKENPTGARAPLKVVYVVLESQYQSSMSAAVKAINDNENSGVACECVGYLLEELRDPAHAAASPSDRTAWPLDPSRLCFVCDPFSRLSTSCSAGS